MNDRLILLTSFSTEIEAQIVRGRLESEGIEVELRDHNLVSTDWLYSNAIGGVKLFVAERDLERAKDVLAEPAASTISQSDESAWGHCPQCGSTNLEYVGRFSVMTPITWLLLGVPLLFARRKFYCAACDESWSAKECNTD